MKRFMEKYGPAIVATLIVTAGLIIAASINDIDEQKKFIGGYGYPQVATATQFYEIDAASATVTYFRYSGTADKTFIKKISVSGNITSQLKAFDTWANRATATYTPIND